MKQLRLIIVMMIWGSVGIFSKSIDMTPVMLAFCRAVISLPILWVFAHQTKKRYKWKDLLPFFISGGLIGFAWCAYFLAFQYTTIAVGILMYNMCPIYVLLLAPRFLGERLTKMHLFQVFSALLGLGLIVFNSLGNSRGDGISNIIGIGFGLLSGMLYALIVILNRRNSRSPVALGSATLMQMIGASSVLLPFVLLQHPISQLQGLSFGSMCMLLVLGIVHTGITYLIYFSTYANLSAISVALISYLEPVFGILFGFLLLGEKMTILQVIGGLLILGVMLFGELYNARKKWQMADVTNI